METANGNGYFITTDRARINDAYVHHYLSVESYWANGIPLETVKKSLDHSLCFGLFNGEQQIGFARMVTDRATYAYLADVFIEDGYRGLGLAAWLMEVIMAHPDLQGLRQQMLATRDAHGLYAKYGFQPLQNPERWMRIANQDVYAKKQVTPVQP